MFASLLAQSATLVQRGASRCENLVVPGDAHRSPKPDRRAMFLETAARLAQVKSRSTPPSGMGT